jgi:tetratricopeptide (TPR) repeat protein
MTDAEREQERERAADLEDARRYDEAIAVLDALLAQHPDDGWALYNRGNVYFKLHDLDRAIASYDAASRVMPGEASPWYNLGIACLSYGDALGGVHIVATDGARVVSPNDTWYALAIDAFTRALALRPHDTPTLVMRGHAYRNRLDDARALADFTAAAELGDAKAAGMLAKLRDEPR